MRYGLRVRNTRFSYAGSVLTKVVVGSEVKTSVSVKPLGSKPLPKYDVLWSLEISTLIRCLSNGRGPLDKGSFGEFPISSCYLSIFYIPPLNLLIQLFQSQRTAPLGPLFLLTLNEPLTAHQSHD